MKGIVLSVIISLCILSPKVKGQMLIDGQYQVGNEWIDYDQKYHKVSITEDGIYRISAIELASKGLSINSQSMERLQLWGYGVEQPIHIQESPSGTLDYLEFYGEKNRGYLDQFLFDFAGQDGQLNPRYSLYTDTMTYWLTIGQEPGLRLDYIDEDPRQSNAGPIPYCIYTEEQQYTSIYDKPLHGSARDRIRYSNFDVGEGFGSGKRTNSEEIISAPKHIAGASVPASLRLQITGNLNSHNQSVSWNGRLVDQLDYVGYDVLRKSYTISTNEIDESNRLAITSNQDNDKHIIGLIELSYPRLLDADNASFFRFALDPFSSEKTINISNVSGANPVLYDVDTGQRLRCEIIGNQVIAVIPPKTQRHTYVLSTDEATSVAALETEYTFTDLSQLSPSYLFLSHASFMEDPEGHLDAYVEYRESTDGGDFDVEVIDVEEVINQFGYGIARHSMAMKNFGEFISTTYDNLEYLMIVGKGRSYSFIRSEEDLNDGSKLPLLVPTFGYPGSDNLITSVGNTPMPRIPTGRLAITDPQQLGEYLTKIKQYESSYALPQTINDQLWQKKIMHLSGGSSGGNEQQSIANSLRQMEEKVEQNKVGADVTTFYKTTSDDLQESTSSSIKSIINEGLRVLTFFGHSSQGTFDFSLEQPSLYDNEGKYPLLISLGCFSGDIHTGSGSLSEDFVLEPRKGSIAFMAASGTAYLSLQGLFGNRFYDLMGTDLYGSSLGNLFQAVAEEYNNDTGIGNRTMLQQFTIHGDPAIKLYHAEGPDLVIDFASINTEPEIITTSGSIELSADIVNLGNNTSTSDSANVQLIHYLPNGLPRDTITQRVAVPANRSNITINIANPGIDGVGRNSVRMSIDIDNEVDEVPLSAAEQNNTLNGQGGQDRYEFFIIDNSIRPIYPENFAIVNTSDIRYVASTSNIFQGEETYIFQLDTTPLFESPILVAEQITVSGGTVEWKPIFSYNPGQVYFWRVSPVASSTVTGQLIWQGASYIYLPNSSPGWNQSDYHQLVQNVEGSTMRYDENRRLKLRPDQNYVRITNNTTRHQGIGFRPTYVGNTFGAWADMFIWEISSLKAGIQIAVLREDRGYWLVPPGGRAGSINDNAQFENIHAFKTETSSDRQILMQFLTDSIPPNYYVIAYSGQWSPEHTYNVEEWENDIDLYGTDLFEVFNSLGISNIYDLKERGDVPFIFMYQNGTGEVYQSTIAETVNDEIEAQWDFPRVGRDGVFHSPVIGPARQWSSILWSEQLDESDSTVVVINGAISEFGELTALDTVRLDYEIDISDINAIEYPYLQLHLRSYDQKRSAGQLDFWRILYEGSPEVTVIPGYFHADTLSQGELLQFQHVVANISSYNNDSLEITYSITNTNNQIKTEKKMIPSLSGGGKFTTSYSYDTKDLVGEHIFQVELNPNQEEIEAYSFNNIGVRRFYVKADDTRPQIDVVFDGLQIMNGDYVSSEPVITITLEDENEFLALDDVSLLQLRLIRLDTNAVGLIDLDSDPRVTFEPSNSVENTARITFEPILDDGEYELLVQGQDVSGNFSGDNLRRISFVVDSESKISNVLNYPNPFSTSTQFVFVLTGAQVPDEIAIQIMTLSGKVVKEITTEELGPLRIGINRTEYRWDGRDEYGSQLANGVYLYRVLTEMNDGEPINDYKRTSIDDFFNEGFGKMVIMR